jgi:nucleoside-diphosphate-sugar epimerase
LSDGHPLVFEPYRARRVLITGAAGFIGRWVARELSAGGATLFLAARDLDALRSVCATYDIRGELRFADLASPGAFAALFRETRPDVVFNLAGYGVDRSERDPALAAALNSRLVAEIAGTLADSNSDWPGLRLVHTGSAFEYGNVPGEVTEDSTVAPTQMYGQTKLAGTQELTRAIERAGVRAVTARLFTVYGPGEHPGRLLPSLIDAARTGETLSMTSGLQERDFTFVADVAEGLLRLGLVPRAAPVVNLATGVLTPMRGFVEIAARVLGILPAKLQFGAIPYRADELKQGRADVSLLEKLVRWRPTTSIEEGVRRTIDFHALPARGRGERVPA